jgi:ATP-dependent RNA helicase DeaD
MTMTKKATNGFGSLGLEPRLTAVLAELGYEEPTPVQAQAIPLLLKGQDVVGQAATGTGKTAAFALPLIQRLFTDGNKRAAVTMLVLVPTRELAMQVAEALHRYGRPVQLGVLPIYGGQPISLQLRALRRGVDVVVATPGRARDHLRRGTLVLGGIRAVVLDEADEMLDMGFAEDLEAILETVPRERQTALFSATIPSRIAAIAKRHMRDAVRLTVVEEPRRAGALPRIRQTAYVVTRAQKVDALSRVLDVENPTAALVFCRTRNEVEELAEHLAGRGHRPEMLHGGFSQVQRDRVMRRFRDGSADLLLATDVAARGLDIRHITHVVNFDLPSSPEAYVHRIGRTGRAGAGGVAITLVEPRERALLRNVERLTRQRIELSAVPTIADLRARRLELTRASLRQVLLRGGTEAARVVVETLATEFDVFEIASAAVHLVQEASERDDQPTARPERAGAAEPVPRPLRQTPSPALEEDYARIYVSAGRAAGVRPADLVGAITGEAAVSGEAVGAIELADRFSLVEVREAEADAVVEALRRATIRGRRVTASRYRPPRSPRPPAPAHRRR